MLLYYIIQCKIRPGSWPSKRANEMRTEPVRETCKRVLSGPLDS